MFKETALLACGLQKKVFVLHNKVVALRNQNDFHLKFFTQVTCFNCIKKKDKEKNKNNFMWFCLVLRYFLFLIFFSPSFDEREVNAEIFIENSIQVLDF